MIPGTTTKLSESTITAASTVSPKTDLVYIFGSVAVNNIIPSFGGGFSGIVCFVNVDSNPQVFNANAAGNFPIRATANISIPQWNAVWFIYSRKHACWFAAKTP